MSQSHSKSRAIKSLLISQFFGAFNDNAWKLIVTFLAIRTLEAHVNGDAEFQRLSQYQTTLTFCVLTLPLMLFSLPAGVLADRLSKRSIIIWMKWVEVSLMSAVAISLFAFPENGFLRLLLLGLMGAQSALFSPAKYGILPELLPHEQLSKGNAYLEMWTFLAIILGTAGGGLLLDSAGERIWLPGLILTLMAAVGLFYAHRIPAVAPARPDGNLLETLRSSWRTIRGERILGLAVAGSVTYWTIVSLLGQDILVYGRTVLGLSDTASGLPLAAFGLGVGMGSLVAGKLSGEKVEYGLIPLGAILMALVSALLALLSPGFAGLLVSTSLLGVASGFIVVPINALVQWQAPASRRGGIIALANVFVFGGILVGSLSATLLAELSFSPQLILSVASLAILLGTLWALWLLPYALLRLGLILLTHTFYRLTVLDRDQVPKEGGVLLTPNHVSFVDALMLIASLDRPGPLHRGPELLRILALQAIHEIHGEHSRSPPQGVPESSSKRFGKPANIWTMERWSVSFPRVRSPASVPYFPSAAASNGSPETDSRPSFPSIWIAFGGVSSVAPKGAFSSRFRNRFPTR